MSSSLESGNIGHFDMYEINTHLTEKELSTVGLGVNGGLFPWHPLVQVLVARNAIRKVIATSETQGGGLFRLFKRFMPGENLSEDGLCVFNPRVVLVDTDRTGMIKVLTELNNSLGDLALKRDYQGIVDVLDEMAMQFGASAVNEKYETV